MSQLLEMLDIKFALRYGWIGVVIALIAFTYNYTMVPHALPGYSILVAPAMLALQLISEETAFWPKITVFLMGQYAFCVILLFILRKIIKHEIYQKK